MKRPSLLSFVFIISFILFPGNSWANGTFLKVFDIIITSDTVVEFTRSKLLYNSITKTLTLENVKYTGESDGEDIYGIVESDIDGLTIKFVGNCKLTSGTGSEYCFILGGNTTITGDTLTLSDFFWEDIMEYHTSWDGAMLLTNDITLTIKEIHIVSNMFWSGSESDKEPIGNLVFSNSEVHFPYCGGSSFLSSKTYEGSNICQFKTVTIGEGTYIYPSRLTFTANAYDSEGNIVARNVATNDGTKCYCGPIIIQRDEYRPLIEGEMDFDKIMPNGGPNSQFMSSNVYHLFSYDMLGLRQGDRIKNIIYRGRNSASYNLDNDGRIGIYYSWTDDYLYGCSALENDNPNIGTMNIISEERPVLPLTYVQNTNKQDIMVIDFQTPIEYEDGKSLCIAFHADDRLGMDYVKVENIKNPLFNNAFWGYYLDDYIKENGKNYIINVPAIHIYLADSTSIAMPNIYYNESDGITLSCSTEGATIHYTLDGSIPSEDSPIYSKPITISKNTSIKAIATVQRGLVHDCSKVATYIVDSIVTGDAFFDGLVAIVSGERTLNEAFENIGGREEAAKTIAAIVWNKEAIITADDIQGINNPNLLLYISDAEKTVGLNNSCNLVVNGHIASLKLTDGYNFYAPQAFTVDEDISYIHTYTMESGIGVSQGWETITLPFDVQTITHESAGTLTPFALYETAMDTKPFWLCELTENGWQQADKIEANKPYIISMPHNPTYYKEFNVAGRVTFSANNITVPQTNPLISQNDNMKFIPTLQYKTTTEGLFAINRSETYGQYPEGSVFVRNLRNVFPFEAYILPSSPEANIRHISINPQTATEIIGISNPFQKSIYYDLGGRSTNQPKHPGIYIKKQGTAIHKVMVK